MSKGFKNIIIFTFLFFTFSLLTSLSAEAQNKNQLAFEYFRNKEYDKASTLFYELYQERRSQYYRTYYVHCLIYSDEFDKAEKFIRKELRSNSNDITLLIDQAYVWEEQGKTDKSQKAYEDIIDDHAYSKQSVKKLANSFLRKRKYELAEKVYKKGRSVMGTQDYYYKLAQLYSIQRNYPEMVETYLDLLESDPRYLDQVRARLQNAGSNDVQDNLPPVLESALISKIKKNPSKDVFGVLLIWHYVQQAKYDKAVDYAKSLDRRNNESGKRLYRLGETAFNNNRPKTGQECFKYIYKNYGRRSPYYFSAKKIELSWEYDEISQKVSPSEEEILNLENDIIELRNQASRKLHYPLTILLAKLQTFYLNKPEEALKQIDSLISARNLDKEQNSKIRILKGDIYLANENPWEASLIYADVEQKNKNNPTGYEAKFKKAKLAYYTGQFEWARSQLDVLKAGTSKLIANDAFELSLFISENTSKDSLEKAMNMFAMADLLEFKRDYDKAVEVLDSISKKFKTGKLADDVIFRKARIASKQGDYIKAVDLYNQVVTDHGWGMLADNSLIEIARLQNHKLNKKDAAAESYKQLLMNYSGSIFTSEARQSLRELRGKIKEKNEIKPVPDEKKPD